QGDLTLQTSFISRYSSLTFTPDPIGDVLYNGISEQAYKRDVAYALQSDAAYRLNAAHTLRAGVYLQRDRLTSDTNSQVLQTDPVTGAPLNDVPVSIVDNSDNSQTIESLYVQDEWKLKQNLVVNYGLRFDHYTAFSSANQLSPRVNFVWLATDD